MQKKENVLNKIKMCWNMCRVYIKCAGMSVEGVFEQLFMGFYRRKNKLKLKVKNRCF